MRQHLRAGLSRDGRTSERMEIRERRVFDPSFERIAHFWFFCKKKFLTALGIRNVAVLEKL
jgi:hypothetical protein